MTRRLLRLALTAALFVVAVPVSAFAQTGTVIDWGPDSYAWENSYKERQRCRTYPANGCFNTDSRKRSGCGVSGDRPEIPADSILLMRIGACGSSDGLSGISPPGGIRIYNSPKMEAP